VAEGADKESKTEEPTQRKLDDARKKGDVAKSMDIPQWASLAAAFGVLAIAGGWMVRDLAEALAPFIARPHAYEISSAGMQDILHSAMWACAPILLGVMLTAAAAGVAGSLLQTGLMFTPSKLKFDFKKISPLGGFKRLFGPDALVQFLKSVVKLCAIGVIVWLVFKPHARELETLAALDPAAMLPLARDLLFALFAAALAFLALTAGFDYFWQRHSFMAKMRMSKEELKEEFKNTEGDPHVKAKLKQIRMERSRQRMMQNVPQATVVVTNPTHYAVALRYVPEEMGAPVCVAKGVDGLALKIREIAAEHGVPVIEDVPLARALYAAVDVDDTIPRQHFEAVAKIIGFILGGRSREPGQRPRHN
jgi:flagellar biosynthetic protein FlhB